MSIVFTKITIGREYCRRKSLLFRTSGGKNQNISSDLIKILTGRPIGPGSPFDPLSPGSPLAPSIPLSPLIPGGPCNPAGPRGPGGPGGPTICNRKIMQFIDLSCISFYKRLFFVRSEVSNSCQHSRLYFTSARAYTIRYCVCFMSPN